MSYKILLLTTLLLLAHSYTDITMLNCPAQFDIAKYNTSSESSLGSFIYSGFQSQSTQDKVVEIVTTGDYQTLNSYQQEMLIPYIIFGVVYFVFYIFTVMCCLFDRSCPPSECIRRNLDEDPYSKT